MSWSKFSFRGAFAALLRDDRPDFRGLPTNDDFILSNRYVAGKYLPSDSSGRYHLTLNNNKSTKQDGRADPPVPPKEMWEGYGLTENEYLESGRRHMSAMQQILAEAGARAQTLGNVLDLGCAAGRMIRFYPCDNEGSEIWGADINAKYVNWCQNHFPPPFLFVPITTLPHLPFEDNFFDLVYCGSVFTHITDLADAWFLEIRRVLRKGGLAYITIQDKLSMQILLDNYASTGEVTASELNCEKPGGEPGTSAAGTYWIHEFDKTLDLRSLDYASFSYEEDPFSNIFYDRQFLLEKWSRFSEIVSVTQQAYGCQTALLCRKR